MIVVPWSYRARRGFTLLESVLALGIASLMLTVLAGVVTRTAVARARAVSATDRNVVARAVLLEMARVIQAGVATDDPADPLRFVVASAPDGAAALRLATFDGDDDVRLVSYRVERTPSGGATGVLHRRTAPRLAPPTAPEPTGDPVLPDMRAFRVRCFDGTTWTTTWTRPGLPRAVEVSLVLDDGSEDGDTLAITVTPAVQGTS